MSTPNDAYYSTLDSIIATINRKLPEDQQDAETLERMLDEVLLHFKFEAMQRKKD